MHVGYKSTAHNGEAMDERIYSATRAIIAVHVTMLAMFPIRVLARRSNTRRKTLIQIALNPKGIIDKTNVSVFMAIP